MIKISNQKYIDHTVLPSGEEYYLADAKARQDIEDLIKDKNQIPTKEEFNLEI